MQIFSFYIDFLAGMTIATLISGSIVLFSRLNSKSKSDGVIVSSARAAFPILALVLVVRSFLYEGYRIPSGSLEPNLLIGDIILVNKYVYGLRSPIGNFKLMPIGRPQRGDAMVFKWPVNTKIYFIKRVIGVPGDTVSYRDNSLYVNGQLATQQSIGYEVESSGNTVSRRVEDLAGDKHEIYIATDRPSATLDEVVVPEGHYFVLGDNRSFSADSRQWGFVPFNHVVGKATRVLFSWNSTGFKLRTERTLKAIQ